MLDLKNNNNNNNNIIINLEKSKYYYKLKIFENNLEDSMYVH